MSVIWVIILIFTIIFGVVCHTIQTQVRKQHRLTFILGIVVYHGDGSIFGFISSVGISVTLMGMLSAILSAITGGILAVYELFEYLKHGDKSAYSALKGIEWFLETSVTWIWLHELLLKLPLWLFLFIVVPICMIVIVCVTDTIISEYL